MKFALLLLLLLTPLARAQSLAELKAQGDAFEAQWKTDEAITAYQKAEALAPNDVEVLCKIAKQYDESMLDVTAKSDKLARGEKGLQYAQRAIAIKDDSALTQATLAVCYGRLAAVEDNKTKLAYSKQVKLHAEKARDLDPKADIPHLVLGCWNLEVADLNPVMRAFARVIYGEIPTATNEDAVKELKTAIALKPDRIGSWFHLGRAYAAMGKDAEAREAFDKSLALPKVQKDDDALKAKAQELLKKLK